MNKALTFSMVAALTLVGCGGGSDSNRQSGQLIDSAVEGVDYRSASTSGQTDAEGRFTYTPGEAITFSIGQITFPVVTAAPVITPLTLAGSSDINNSAVINIARLLQTLDNDQDPDNGIRVVAPAATAPLDFSLTPEAFETQVQTLLSLTLVDQAAAIAHLQSELDKLQNANGSGAGSGTDPLAGERVIVTEFPEGIVGEYKLQFDQENPGSGITDGSVAEFEVTADGDLILPNNRTLSTAYFYNNNDAEYVWLDTQNNLSYELALFDDFVDLNIGNGKKAQSQTAEYVYYGKYKTPDVIPDQTPAQILSGFTGNYSSTVSFVSITAAEATQNSLPAPPDRGDSISLVISAAGVLSVDGYTFDPSVSSFNFSDKTQDRFGPRYELTQTDASGNLVTLSLRVPGEPFAAYDLSVQKGSTFVGSISADITPYASSLQSFLDDLGDQLPAKATLVATGTNTAYVGAALCDTVNVDLDFSGIAKRPRLLTQTDQEGFFRPNELRPENANLTTDGSVRSADFAQKQLSLSSQSFTLRSVAFGGVANGDVLTTDSALISATCSGKSLLIK